MGTTTTGRPAGRPPVKKRVVKSFSADKSPYPAPSELGDIGASIWHALWNASSGQIDDKQDRFLILMICKAYEKVYRYELSIATYLIDPDDPEGTPEFYLIPNGSWATHPMVKEIAVQETKITGWLAALGYSVADRHKFNIFAQDANDPAIEAERRKAERERLWKAEQFRLEAERKADENADSNAGE